MKTKKICKRVLAYTLATAMTLTSFYVSDIGLMEAKAAADTVNSAYLSGDKTLAADGGIIAVGTEAITSAATTLALGEANSLQIKHDASNAGKLKITDAANTLSVKKDTVTYTIEKNENDAIITSNTADGELKYNSLKNLSLSNVKIVPSVDLELDNIVIEENSIFDCSNANINLLKNKTITIKAGKCLKFTCESGNCVLTAGETDAIITAVGETGGYLNSMQFENIDIENASMKINFLYSMLKFTLSNVGFGGNVIIDTENRIEFDAVNKKIRILKDGKLTITMGSSPLYSFVSKAENGGEVSSDKANII